MVEKNSAHKSALSDKNAAGTGTDRYARVGAPLATRSLALWGRDPITAVVDAGVLLVLCG